MQNIKFKISSPMLLILLACCLLLSGCSYVGGSSGEPTVSDRLVHQTRLGTTDCKKKANSNANGNVSVKGLSKVKDGYGIPGAYMKDKNYTGQNWSKGDAERGKGIFTSEDFAGMGGCSGDDFSKQNCAIAARWEYTSYQVASGMWPGWSAHGCTDGLASFGATVDNEQYAWVVKQKVLVYCPKTKKSVICIVGDGKSNPNWGGSPLAAMAGLSYKAQEALGLSRGQCLDENLEMEMWWCDDENATPGPSTMSLDGNLSSSDSVSSETASNLNTAANAGTTSNPNSALTSGGSSKGEQIKIPDAIKDKQANGTDYYGPSYTDQSLGGNQGKVKEMWKSEGSKNDCGLPTYKGRYGVVVSSQIAAAGDYLDLVYTDGNVLKCFVTDVKSPQDGGYVYEGKTWGDVSGDKWKLLEWILEPKGLNDKGHETLKSSKISWCLGTVDYIVKYGNMVKGDNPPDGVASGNVEQDDECGGSKSSESSSVIGSGLQGAINWAKKNALDANLGYSMTNGRNDVMDESMDDKPRNGDCSSFVYAALVRGGGFTDIKEATGGAPFGTGGMTDTLTKCGWEKHELTDVSELKPGDVLFVHQNFDGGKQHTALYCEEGGVIAEESWSYGDESRGDQKQKIDENGYDSVGECRYYKSESYIKSEFTNYFRYTGSGSGNDSSKSK